MRDRPGPRRRRHPNRRCRVTGAPETKSSGSGTATLPRIATVAHSGGSNFIVTSLDRDGTEGDTLVNAIGAYRGSVLFNIDEGTFTEALTVKADGPWTIRLKPIGAAERWTGAVAHGRGDQVLRLLMPTTGLTTATITHQGSDNFIVNAYSGTEQQNLINEIGRYDGQALLPDGTALITISADGRWNLRRE
ncbi:hypothetical protein [Actinomadura rayongensis]|uniref:Uncharacterized protein n=1 Tax=Actinomadura rayongensis TaxID=1429076 RepID=A0A6I4W5T7_9ACTN|nr:hypothetical protein [Actinomadura rayongensis]MXQ64841.1 hypothetical protein [Actinomadura rayongensis]